MAKFTKFSTNNGMTGHSLAKVIEFLIGQKPLKYSSENRQHNFYLNDKIFESEKAVGILKDFSDFFQCSVNKISEFSE